MQESRRTSSPSSRPAPSLQPLDHRGEGWVLPPQGGLSFYRKVLSFAVRTALGFLRSGPSGGLADGPGRGSAGVWTSLSAVAV